MGPRHATIIACVQYSNLALTGIAYNITAATSMQAVACPSGGDTCSVECALGGWAAPGVHGSAQPTAGLGHLARARPKQLLPLPPPLPQLLGLCRGLWLHPAGGQPAAQLRLALGELDGCRGAGVEG